MIVSFVYQDEAIKMLEILRDNGRQIKPHYVYPMIAQMADRHDLDGMSLVYSTMIHDISWCGCCHLFSSIFVHVYANRLDVGKTKRYCQITLTYTEIFRWFSSKNP